MSTLRNYLLGGLTLRWDDSPPLLIPGKNARSLLAYLVTYRDRPHTRDLLAGVFWPDLPDAEARRRLTHALWQIRHALSGDDTSTERPPVLRVDHDTVQLHPALPVWVDAQEFMQQAQKGLSDKQAVEALQAAADLYRGDFLAGYYDDWALVERERLQERYIHTLEQLVARNKARGDYESALLFARRLVGIAPWSEQAHMEIMRLCHMLGRDTEALKQYEDCCRVLSEQLGVAPGEEMASLADEITQGLSAPLPRQASTLHRSALPAHIPLVGREQEYADLLGHLNAALGGIGGFVLLEGPAGVGKTRLLEEFSDQAEWRGAQILWGRCREMAGQAPFALWAETLKHAVTPLRLEQLSPIVDRIWLQVLGSLLPGLPEYPPAPALAPDQECARLCEAIGQLLRAWSQAAPLVLLLEDLHWADEDSLDVLANLGARLRNTGVLVIGSYRDDEARSRPVVWERLQSLSQTGLRQRLALQPLSIESAGELIRRGLGTSWPAPLFETRLYHETGGNPLFLLEVLRALHDEGLLFQAKDDTWRTPWDETTQAYEELPVPDAVERVITRRLGQLGAMERSVVDAAAVLGGEFAFAWLYRLLDQEAAALLPVLRRLIQSHFLIEKAATYDFSHDQVQQVVYRSLSPELRRQLHRRAYALFAELLPQQLARLALHATQGERWEDAVYAHQKAGDEALRMHANQAAWEHYQQALSILDAQRPFLPRTRDELRFDVLLACHSLAWTRGQIEQAQAAIDELLRLADRLSDPLRRADALNRHAYHLCNTLDEYQYACQVAEQALEVATQHSLDRQAAVALRNLGQACHRSDDYARAEVSLQKSLALWQSIEPHSSQVAEVQIYLAQVYEQTGDIVCSDTLGKQAADTAQSAETPLTLARAYALLARNACRRGDYADCVRFNQTSLEQVRQVGHKQNEAAVVSNLGYVYWGMGDYARAIQCQEQGLEIYRQIANRRGMLLAAENLAEIYCEIGQYDKAQGVVDEGLSLARQLNYTQGEVHQVANQGRVHLGKQQPEQALQTYAEALRLAGTIQSPYVAAAAHLGMGWALSALGDYRQAGEHFLAALKDYQAAGEEDFANAARAYLAFSLLEQGAVEKAHRLSAQAVDHLKASQGGECVPDIYYHHARILSAGGQARASKAALHDAYQAVVARANTLPDDSWRRDYWEQVELNRKILAAWQGVQAEPTMVRLPRLGVPSGRPLRPEEYIEVAWTVEAVEDDLVAEKVARRQGRVLRLLRQAAEQGAAPTVEVLALALGVSRATIKRDLAALREIAPNVRTRGSRK